MCDHEKSVEQHTDRELILEMYSLMLKNQVEHERSRYKVEQALWLARVVFLAVFGLTIGRLFGLNIPEITS